MLLVRSSCLAGALPPCTTPLLHYAALAIAPYVRVHVLSLLLFNTLIQVPDIEFADFEKAAKRAKPSVAPEELDHFTEWTTEFGQEG